MYRAALVDTPLTEGTLWH